MKKKDEKNVFRKELLNAKKNLMVIGAFFAIALVVQIINIAVIASKGENAYTIQCVQVGTDEYRYMLTEQNAAAAELMEVTLYDYQQYKQLGSSYCKYKLLRDGAELGMELLLICVIFFILDSLVDDVRKTQDYFTVSIAKRIRWISRITCMVVLVPKFILLISDYIKLSSATFTITPMDIFMLVLAVVLYIVSKVIQAGRALKEELAQIA